MGADASAQARAPPPKEAASLQAGELTLLSPVGDESPPCPMCTGEGVFLGVLGRVAHYRCRACGWTFEGTNDSCEELAAKTYAIVGSRDYPDLDAVRRYVATLPEGCTVVSGGARGVDRVGAQAARQRGLRVVEYLPDWDRFGKRAGFLRNEQIVAAADTVIAFWDGESRGTKHTIDFARRAKKPCHVVIPGAF